MTQEEFQKVVLKELKGLKEGIDGLSEDVGGLKEEVSDLKDGQKQLFSRVDTLEKGQNKLMDKVDTLEEGQIELTGKVDVLDRKIDAIYDQTAFLTEFKEEVSKDIKNNKADNEVLKEMVVRHEIEIKALERKIG